MSIESLLAARDTALRKLHRAGKEAQGAENDYSRLGDQLVLARHKAGETGVIRLKARYRA